MRDSRHTGALTIALAAAVLAAGCSHAASTDASDGNSTTTPSTIRIATPAGEFVVQGDILKKYNSLGGTTSPPGLPITDEQAGPNGGRYSRFEGGAIYWTAQTGAHIVWGAIRAAFEHENGGAGGPLGYPTTDEYTVPGGWQSQFQHGTITYTDGQPHVQVG